MTIIAVIMMITYRMIYDDNKDSPGDLRVMILIIIIIIIFVMMIISITIHYDDDVMIFTSAS